MTAIQTPDQRLRIFCQLDDDELGTLIADDLAVLLSERFDLGIEPPERGSTGVLSTPSEPWDSSACCRPHSDQPLTR